VEVRGLLEVRRHVLAMRAIGRVELDENTLRRADVMVDVVRRQIEHLRATRRSAPPMYGRPVIHTKVGRFTPS
jgi:hypothetical protein